MSVFQAPPLFTLAVKFTACAEDAVPPSYATDGSAAFDFYYPASLPRLYIGPHSMMSIPTGLKIEVPVGYQMLLFARSGFAAKYRVSLENGVGVIDSDYRGEVMGLLCNNSHETFIVQPGDRFMQGQILPVVRTIFVPQDTLSSTARGEGGFGSTGKA